MSSVIGPVPFSTPATRRPGVSGVHARQRSASMALAILLVGLFVDYGGGIGVKYLAILVAFVWVGLHRSSYAILATRWRDLVVLIGVPILLAALHLFLGLFGGAAFEPMQFTVRLYNTISAASLIVLFPLLLRAGSATVVRQLRRGFAGVAIVLLLMFLLHSTGLVNWSDYTDLFFRFQLGAVGLDSRITDADVTQRGQYSLRIAFAMPLIFGAEVAASGLGAGVLFTSLLVAGSRGLTAAAALIFVLMLLLSGWRLRRASVGRAIAALVLAVGIVAAVPALRFRFLGVFLERTAAIGGGADYTTLVRIGHLAGYWRLVTDNPWVAVIGAGPTATIVNPVLAATFGDGRVASTEFSVLNLAIYYGMPYAILYAGWLMWSARTLYTMRRSPAFTRTDLGLVVGALVFWITGNVNPQMTAPFAIIAFMLLVIRTSELRRVRWPA